MEIILLGLLFCVWYIYSRREKVLLEEVKTAQLTLIDYILEHACIIQEVRNPKLPTEIRTPYAVPVKFIEEIKKELKEQA